MELETGRIPAEGLVLQFKGADGESHSSPLIKVRLHTEKPALETVPAAAAGEDFMSAVWLGAYEGRNAVEANNVLIKRRGRGWLVYVDDVLSARFPQLYDGAVELTVEAPAGSGEDSEPFVQRVAPFKFTDDFLVDESDEQGKALGQWRNLGGNWSVFSVADAVTDPNAPPQVRRGRARRRAGRIPEAERSPNFYCLTGSGSNAVFLTGYDFYDRYRMSAAVHAGDGENGIIFLATEGGGFHAFTATPDKYGDKLEFCLWSSGSGKIEDRNIIGRWKTDLLPGQWHQLAVSLHDEGLVPAVNNISFPFQKIPLPSGGSFGLFSHGSEETRFDDVAAFSHEDIHFADPAQLRGKLSGMQGELSAAKGSLPLQISEDSGEKQSAGTIKLAGTPEVEGRIIFGSRNDGPHVLATAVKGTGKPQEAALLTGFKGDGEAFLRFVFRQKAGERVFLLERCLIESNSVVELVRLVQPGKAGSDAVELMLDTTDPDGLVRAYADGRLVLVSPEPFAVEGASGIAVPAGGRVEMALPWYRSSRPVYRNKFEKTQAFAIDPYMRHWASPEGEWMTTREEETWLKGDRFGALGIQLPHVADSRLHLAVPEDKAAGALQIAATQTNILVTLADNSGTNFTEIASLPAQKLAWRITDAEGKHSNRWFSAHLEDHVFWLRSGDSVIHLETLPDLLAGRRTRLEGFNVPQLAQTRVDRTGVMDFLFTESLYEWTINGGEWEVVNRFQCDPRWSHLNGQNGSGLAALWAHYEFEGDFCAELYAGMRHGWYDRSGDFNLTILGSAASPASGYTFVCTGWDPDESQTQSRFFRNGRLLGRTDKYLAPRIREGNVRRGFNPLIASGRDVHGAWYYTQLRRAGGEIEVSFDNEPVLSVTDPEPLKKGSFGIWTFRNSMVVARVKVAAEHIRPKQFALESCSAESPDESLWPEECMPLVVRVAEAAGVSPQDLPASELNPEYPGWPEALAVAGTTNGIPLAYWTPDVWAVRDPVSNARLSWQPDIAAPDQFVMTARQAGGSFLASNNIPAVPLRYLAGWRFEIARTEGAQVNFHYQAGRKPADKFEPAQGFFHELSGTGETRGPRIRSGGTEIPAAKNAEKLLEGPWTTVEVWLPAFPKEEDTLWLKVEGFGNLQPSDVMQGLSGNLPGAAYAVRNFRPVFMGEPQLDSSLLNEEAAGKMQAALDVATVELQSAVLPGAFGPLPATVSWVSRPDNMNLVAKWDPQRHDAIDIRSEISWPIRFLKGLTATVNEQEARIIPREGNRLTVLIPRDIAIPENGIYQVSLSTSPRRPVSWGLPAESRDKAAPPVLVAVESPLFQLQNFEKRIDVPDNAVNGQIRLTDPQQGNFLQTGNRGQALRLMTPLLGGFNLAQNPLLRFRYKYEGMANVSVRLQGFADLAFTETPPYHNAGRVRSTPTTTGEDWSIWRGYLADHVTLRPFRSADLQNFSRIVLQSCHPTDQTGRYAMLAVDDIVAGPAVGPQRPFDLTPHLFDLDGDGFVQWTVMSVQDPAVAVAEPGDAAEWQSSKSGDTIAVPLGELADGLHEIYLRAASPRGPAPVTAIPFLVDSKPIQVAHRLYEEPEFGNGSLLEFKLDLAGGSPPQLQNLKVSCGDNDVQLRGHNTRLSMTANEAVLRINWPLLLRPQIQAASDGDKLPLRFDGISDGAGNLTEAVDVEIPIDFASDKRPPTIMSATASSNVLWMTSWLDNNFAKAFAALRQCTGKVLPGTTNSNPVLQFLIQGNSAFAGKDFKDPAWSCTEHSWLAFRGGFSKLPAKTSAATLQIALLYKIGKGNPKPVTVDLFQEADKLPDFVKGTVDWKAGGTTELFVNVPAMLSAHLKSDKIEGEVTGFQFVFNQAQGSQFTVEEAFVTSAWREDDHFALRAYDASGIAGVVWQGGGESKGLRINPAQIVLPDNDAQWIRLQVRDRAGNNTLPFALPVIREVSTVEKEVVEE